MTKTNKITGYIWYNPETGMYQKGSKEDYQFFYEGSGMKEGYSLILKLTNQSDLLAYRLVRDLNNMKQKVLDGDATDDMKRAV